MATPKKTVITMSNTERRKRGKIHGMNGKSRRSCRKRYYDRKNGREPEMLLYSVDEVIAMSGIDSLDDEI